jgi:hypothetical protein
VSTEDPRDRPPSDDLFAFAPDDRDRRETGRPENAGPPAAGEPGGETPSGRSGDVPSHEAPPSDDGPASGDAPPVGPSAADRARRAAYEAEAERARRAARASSTRWLVAGGLLLVLLALGSTLVAGRGADDATQVRPGERLPAFAAPVATRPRVAHDDVNLATRDGQGAAGDRAACSVRVPSAVTSCALLRRGPLVLVVFSRGLQSCLRTVDDVDRAARGRPGLAALAVETRGEHDETARTVRARGWALTTVYDADGALSSRLGAAVCPLVLFVRRDGTVVDRLIGEDATGAAIRARTARLVRAATTPAGAARAPAGR